MKQARLFVMERRMTELELLKERKQAVEHAIRALEKYQLLQKVRTESGTNRLIKTSESHRLIRNS